MCKGQLGKKGPFKNTSFPSGTYGEGVGAQSFPYITGSRELAVKGFGHPGICLFLFVWLPGDVLERAGTRPLSSSMPLIAELGKPVCVADFLGEMVFLEKGPVTLQAGL